MGIKDLLLNKGWAGTTIDRAETVDRINPVIRSLTELMHYYEFAASQSAQMGKETIAQSQRTLRMDIGKLCETVYSCGGVAYSGTDIEPGSLTLDGSVPDRLTEHERAFCDLVDAEGAIEHQIRTRAVLGVARANGEARLAMIRSLAGR
jgi:hypothetical protein